MDSRAGADPAPERNPSPSTIATPGKLRLLVEVVYRNLPNIVSMLGVVILSVLFLDDGFRYFIPVVILNNVMDDLDGILARGLHLSSAFGARLDNVCDAVSHILISMAVGIHFGGVVLAFSLVASVAILVRVVQRLAPSPVSGIGSPTSELMRHLLLVVILYETFSFEVAPVLAVVFAVNSVSMLVPFPLPYMVRSMAKSLLAVVGVNVLLLGQIRQQHL
ncbi:MAG: CDP-alcohol phosphatidyltransferase family protein [Acidimicrobiales bacterium]